MVLNQDDLSFLQTCNRPRRNMGKKTLEKITAYSEAHGTTLFVSLKQMLSSKELSKREAQEYVNLIDKYSAKYKDMNLTDLFSALLDESGYEDNLRLGGEQERIDNLALLKQEIYEYESTFGEKAELEDYLAHISLLVSEEVLSESGKVNLMTVHAAKGLEFPCVFVCCLNEWIFPSKKQEARKEWKKSGDLLLLQ